MSPQSRRGRAPQPSHRKSPARGAATASRKPAAAAAADEFDEEAFDDQDARESARASKDIPVRRQRGLARLKRTPYYKYADELFGAYLPLVGAFAVIFILVWGWISFGPHAPTARDLWTTAENQWHPQRVVDRQKTIADAANFDAQLTDYKALLKDTKGWMDALTAITNEAWDGPSPSPSLGADGTAMPLDSDLVNAFITAGDTEVADLTAMVAAKSSDSLAILGSSIVTDDQAFDSAYEAARSQIMGVAASASQQATLALPSVCPAASASASPTASSGASASPSASPSLSASPSPSAGAGASPAACASAAASASVGP